MEHDFRMTFKKLPQFSLKTLLLFVTGVCVLAAFVASCSEIAASMLLFFCIATAPGYCFGIAISALVRSRTAQPPSQSPDAPLASLIPQRLQIAAVSVATGCTLLCMMLPSSDIGPELVAVTILFIGVSIFGAVFPCRLRTIPTVVAATWTLLFLPPSPFQEAGFVGASIAFAAASVLGIVYARRNCRAFFIGSAIPTVGCVIVQIILMMLSYGMRHPVRPSVSEVLINAVMPAPLFWLVGALTGIACIAIRHAFNHFYGRKERLEGTGDAVETARI